MEDEDDGAEGGEDGEEEPAGGFDGHGDRAEDDREEDDREADDEDAEGHERLAELVGDVDLDGRGPGDGGVEPIVVLDLALRSRSRLTVSRVAGSSEAVVGMIWNSAVVASRFGVARTTWSTPGTAAMRFSMSSTSPRGSSEVTI